MSLIKWEPFDDFDRLFRDFGALPATKLQNMSFDLAADLYEDGDNLVAEMNLPGLKGDDIEVSIEDGHLRVSGKREEVEEKKEKSHYAKEIRRGSFERIIRLPDQVDETTVDAQYTNGVLKVTMPKKALPPANKIKVKVNE
jgi:HSP20 family protein